MSTDPRTTPRHILTAAVPLVLGALAVYGSIGLGLGSLTAPGPGLWPFIVGIMIMLGSVGVLLTGSDGEPFVARSGYVFAAVGALVAFVILFARVGFVLPALLLLASWLRWISHEAWTMTIGVTVLATVILYAVFDMALGVPFPFDVITGR